MGFLRQHETGRSFDLPHDPVAVRHTGKRKTAVLGRGGSQNGVFGHELGAVRTEQPDQRTGKAAAVLVLFQPVDLTVSCLDVQIPIYGIGDCLCVSDGVLQFPVGAVNTVCPGNNAASA